MERLKQTTDHRPRTTERPRNGLCGLFLWSAVCGLWSGCTGNEARERWQYEKVIWEDRPEIASAEDARTEAAKTAAKTTLTIADAYRLALHRSETLAIEGEELVRIQTLYEQAYGSLLPRINFKGSYTKQDEVDSGSFSTFTLSERTEYKFTLQQPIFSGLREFYAMRQSDALYGAKEHDLRHARLLLYFDVAQSFYLVLQARRELETVQASLSLASERLEELRERNRLGISRRSEVLQQEAEVASIEAQRERLKGILEVAWETFQFLTGLETRPALSDPQAEGPEVPPVKTLVERAILGRADLRSLEQQIFAGEQAVKIAQGGYLPTVTLDANYYTHRAGVSAEIDWDVFLTFDVPIFDGFSTYAKIREAESIVRATRLARERLLRDISLQIHRAHADVLSFRSELVSLEKAVSSASETYDIVQAEYRQGIVTNIEVLQAFNTLQRARLERDRSRFQLRIALVRLSVESGVLP